MYSHAVLSLILAGCRSGDQLYASVGTDVMLRYALDKKLSRSQSRAERGDVEENLIMQVIDVLLCSQ